VVGFLVQEKQRHPELTASELAARLLEEKGVELHRRTVEKIVAGLGGGGRRKKKPPRGR
jgi:transposase